MWILHVKILLLVLKFDVKMNSIIVTFTFRNTRFVLGDETDVGLFQYAENHFKKSKLTLQYYWLAKNNSEYEQLNTEIKKNSIINECNMEKKLSTGSWKLESFYF